MERGVASFVALGLALLVLAGCGRWARAERVAFHTGAEVESPGPFFDRVVEAIRAAGYETVNEDRAAGTIDVPARRREGMVAGSFTVRVFLDGSVEVVARGEERRGRARRGGEVASRVVRRPVYEESLELADRLARGLGAVAMTEPLARQRVEGE